MVGRLRKVVGLPAPQHNAPLSHVIGNFSSQVLQECGEGGGKNKSAKVIVLGNAAVGKTSLLNRLSSNVFNPTYKATIGVDFMVERFLVAGSQMTLQIWDTAGQERFKCVSAAYYRGARCVVLVFDLSNPTSLDSITQWLEDAKIENGNNDFQVFLVGCKLDLCASGNPNSIISTTARSLAAKLDAEYWEVSSLTGSFVTECFTRIAAVLFDSMTLEEYAKTNKKTGSLAKKNQKSLIGNGSDLLTLKPIGSEEVTATEQQQNQCCT